MFAASDIASVIALAKPENGCEWTKADEESESAKPMAAHDLSEKVPSLFAFLKAAAETPCLPAISFSQITPIISDSSAGRG